MFGCSACGEWRGALGDDELVQQLRHAHRGRGSMLTRDTQLSDTGAIILSPVAKFSVADPDPKLFCRILIRNRNKHTFRIFHIYK
jgi:hypothetical protein